MIATHTLTSTDAQGHVTVVQQVAGGRSAALFAVLAGASMALMSGRTEPVTGVRASGWRSAWSPGPSWSP